MQHISEDATTKSDVFNLSLINIKKMLAISLLNAKNDGYRLNEFIDAL